MATEHESECCCLTCFQRLRLELKEARELAAFYEAESDEWHRKWLAASASKPGEEKA